jgi:hypothetical protein
MYNKLPIQIKAVKPIVTAIVDEVVEEVQHEFNVVDVSVEKQETEPPTWKLFLQDANGQRYTYDLHFFKNEIASTRKI